MTVLHCVINHYQLLVYLRTLSYWSTFD